MANTQAPPIPLNNLHTSVQGGTHNDGAQKDSENEVWNMYLTEVKEEDTRITNAWKEDANGILVFAGLFSATVGAFIIEFYKKLSPDSGDETVTLLRQISQQLPNSPIPPNSSPSNTANPSSSSPSASMVWVNAMWLISLVLTLTSALIATLLQQWARRYIQTPKVPSEPNDRARVRSFLFLGTELYRMRFLVELAPTLLHFSVYLFFGGLVIVFHTIYKKVAIAVDVAVGLFALAYTVLTIIPFLDTRCPYRTPMTYILWYSLHTFLSFITRVFYWLLEWLHGCLVSPSLDGTMSRGQRMVVDWSTSCESTAKKHWRYIMDGFGKSIIDSAKDLEDGERKIVTWMFSQLALYDKNKLRKFAACIPRNRVLSLIPLIESGTIVLRESLFTLLRSCATGTRAAGPDDEGVRKRSLLVCLDAIHHIAKTPTIPDLTFMRANFADIRLLRASLDDDDTSIRVPSRSICALVARQVIRGSLEEPQLRWLQEVTGETSNTMFNASIATRDRMNLKSFVYGVLSSTNQAGEFPTETFKETLAILLDVRTGQGTDVHFEMITSKNRLDEEVEWLKQDDPQRSYEVVNRLRLIFPFLPLPFPIPMNQPGP